MTRPTSGTAIDVEGTISATISWNTLSDRRIVMPAQHAHYIQENDTSVTSMLKRSSCCIATIVTLAALISSVG